MLANQAKSLAIAFGVRLPFGSLKEPMWRDITATTGGLLILKRNGDTRIFVENDDDFYVDRAAQRAKVIKRLAPSICKEIDGP
jgi:hypothetical protein